MFLISFAVTLDGSNIGRQHRVWRENASKWWFKQMNDDSPITASLERQPTALLVPSLVVLLNRVVLQVIHYCLGSSGPFNANKHVNSLKRKQLIGHNAAARSEKKESYALALP